MIKYGNFILCLVLPVIGIAQDVSSMLTKMPLEDRQQVEKLFYLIMSVDDGYYTLFGDKPISLSGHYTLTPVWNTLKHGECGGTYQQYWETWEKYKKKFPWKITYLLKNPLKTAKTY